MLQQLLRVLDAVQCGARKTGYLLRDDEVKAPRLGICDHPIEAIPLFRACSADPLVNIPGYVRPIGLRLDQFRVILHLIFQAVELLVLVGGYPCIVGHSQRQVINTPAVAHLIAYFQYIHRRLPPSGSTKDIETTPESLLKNVPNSAPQNRWIWI